VLDFGGPVSIPTREEDKVTPNKALSQYQAAESADAPILITDKHAGNVIHVLPCRSEKAAHFAQKVLTNGERKG
jgi:hypothetical protein